ncbi:hypothetical protein IAQ61_003916 [Plenodomus lingam]|uniref:uncharacterized protein n=1 Tax=Leptosphaeria maculans TaxID=5022 RepID=UPI003325B995|nr:hypothetical protein IAQ61_003916 [Plenodomus lingam]
MESEPIRQHLCPKQAGFCGHGVHEIVWWYTPTSLTDMGPRTGAVIRDMVQTRLSGWFSPAFENQHQALPPGTMFRDPT